MLVQLTIFRVNRHESALKRQLRIPPPLAVIAKKTDPYHKMDLLREINKIYDSRHPIEQRCLDMITDILQLIDINKLLEGNNHSFVENNSILTIALQHRTDTDRIILFLFQDDFIELQFDSRIEVYEYSHLINNKETKEEFRNLIFAILDSSYKHVEYYLNNDLIKYTSIWDDNFLPEKTIFIKPFERIKETFNKRRYYMIKEKRALSFFAENK